MAKENCLAATRAEIGNRKRARTRKTLTEAAMRVFARLGPETPTIDDFITEAGVARGTFYNYFETREELLIAVATEVSEQLQAQMSVLRSLPDPAERLGCAVRMFIRKAAEDPTFGWAIVQIALIAAPLGARMRDNLAADVEAGLAAGRFRSSSVQAAYDLVLGVGLMGMRSVLRGEAGPNHAEDIARIVLLALAVDDAEEIAHRSMDAAALATRAGQMSINRPGTVRLPKLARKRR